MAYSPINGMAWAWNHRTARDAEKAVMRHCQGPQARLWACGADQTIAIARGPRGAYSCKGAHPSVVTLACQGALQNCRGTYPLDDPDREHVRLALVLDTRHGPMYRP